MSLDSSRICDVLQIQDLIYVSYFYYAFCSFSLYLLSSFLMHIWPEYRTSLYRQIVIRFTTVYYFLIFLNFKLIFQE